MVHSVEYNPLQVSAPRRRTHRNKRRFIGRDTLTHRILLSWYNIKSVTRSLVVEKPSEGYLLSLLIASDLAFFFSWTLKAIIVPDASGLHLFSSEIGLLLIVALVGRTAAFYLFAMTLGAVCRLFGGRGTWRNTRIAVFWAALVAAPIGMFAAMMSVLFAYLTVHFPIFGASWINLPPYWMGFLPFIWFIAAGVGKVHGFRSTGPLFLALSFAALAALLGGMYFRARGMI